MAWRSTRARLLTMALPNLSSLESGAGTAFSGLNTASALAKSILVRPKTPPVGIAGFIFDFRGEDTVELQSDITDHYTEANYAIQDHIALRPERITCTGYVGELTNRAQGIFALIAPFVSKLPMLGQFAPKLTAGALDIYNKATRYTALVERTVMQAKDLYGFFTGKAGDPKKDKQTKAYQYFRDLWKSRQIVSVETPWGVYKSMAIESIRAVQDESSRYISEFTITFKEFRTASEILVSAKKLDGRMDTMNKEKVDTGNAETTPIKDSDRQSVIYKGLAKVFPTATQ